MGRAAREEAQRLAEVQKRGAELRREMAKKAATLKAEKSERLTQLKKDQDEAEALKSEKEAIKSDAESRENAALKVYREAEELEKQQKANQQKEESEKEAKTMFKAFDSNTDGRYFADFKSEYLCFNVFITLSGFHYLNSSQDKHLIRIEMAKLQKKKPEYDILNLYYKIK
jgi:DNA repair exonuclease SbcCD ATPase subunit